MGHSIGWAIGYNAVALPIAAGVFAPTFGLVLRPEIATLTMAGSNSPSQWPHLETASASIPAERDPRG
jgi:Cu2+-exporting ATPase